MAKQVFISYASADQDTANKLVAEIERRGIECWMSSRNIRPGQDYQKEIVSALENCGVVLLLFSQHANESVEIPKELALASRFRKTIIPARIEDIVPSGSFAYQITSAQFIDLFRGFEAKVEDLCAYLAEVLTKQGETVQLKPVKHRVHIGGGGGAKKWAIAGAVVVVLAVLAWAIGSKFMGHGTAGNAGAAAAPAVSTTPAAPVAVAKASPAAVPAAEPKANPSRVPAASVAEAPSARNAGGAPEAAAPSAGNEGAVTAASNGAVNPASNAPVGAAPGKFLRSENYGGIRFDVKSINVNNLRAPVVLISATNTQQQDLKFTIYRTPEAKLIDNNGAASDGFQVHGVPFCTDYLNNCSKPDSAKWTEAYRNTPLDIALSFRGPQEFRGTNATLTFTALLATENEDGSLKPALVPVVLPNLLIREGTAKPLLTSRSYQGINFEVASAKADGKAMRVLIYATNAGQQDLRFEVFRDPPPTLVDSNAASSGGYRLDGVPFCGGYLKDCSQPDPTKWIEAYRGIPLAMVWNFNGPQDFRGTSGSVSFTVLLGAENEDGSLKVSVVQVVLPGIAISH